MPRRASLAATNWRRVVDLYGAAAPVQPSPTIARRAVRGDGSPGSGRAQGLADLDEVIELGGLERYPYAFGARAQMLAGLDRHTEAASGLAAAAGCARTAAEREYFTAQAQAAARRSRDVTHESVRICG